MTDISYNSAHDVKFSFETGDEFRFSLPIHDSVGIGSEGIWKVQTSIGIITLK